MKLKDKLQALTSTKRTKGWDGTHFRARPLSPEGARGAEWGRRSDQREGDSARDFLRTSYGSTGIGRGFPSSVPSLSRKSYQRGFKEFKDPDKTRKYCISWKRVARIRKKEGTSRYTLVKASQSQMM